VQQIDLTNARADQQYAELLEKESKE